MMFGPGTWSDEPPVASMASELTRLRTEAEKAAAQGVTPQLQPADRTAADGNEMRPESWDEVVGQERVKDYLIQFVRAALDRDRPLSHCLFRGPAGTGKTTLANVIANELGRRIFQLEAPISNDTLLDLARTMQRGDILVLDEIHQQAFPDRRGAGAATKPEVLFSVMEDFTLPTAHGIVPFPRITVMGATTDEGALPDAFIDRFPIKPMLEAYTPEDMDVIAIRSARKVGMTIDPQAALTFADASRGVPREVNNFLRNADDLGKTHVTAELASRIVHDLNGYTDEGLTPDMQGALVFLYTRCQRVVKDEVRYQASVNSIATAIGKSRDTKAVQLRVEPYLIRCGYLQVLHGGRALTLTGQERAHQLAADRGLL
jgi:Holliday junction DNA helicase RuvB